MQREEQRGGGAPGPQHPQGSRAGRWGWVLGLGGLPPGLTFSGPGSCSWLTSRGVMSGMVSKPSSSSGCLAPFSARPLPSFTMVPVPGAPRLLRLQGVGGKGRGRSRAGWALGEGIAPRGSARGCPRDPYPPRLRALCAPCAPRAPCALARHRAPLALRPAPCALRSPAPLGPARLPALSVPPSVRPPAAPQWLRLRPPRPPSLPSPPRLPLPASLPGVPARGRRACAPPRPP